MKNKIMILFVFGMVSRCLMAMDVDYKGLKPQDASTAPILREKLVEKFETYVINEADAQRRSDAMRGLYSDCIAFRFVSDSDPLVKAAALDMISLIDTIRERTFTPESEETATLLKRIRDNVKHPSLPSSAGLYRKEWAECFKNDIINQPEPQKRAQALRSLYIDCTVAKVIPLSCPPVKKMAGGFVDLIDEIRQDKLSPDSAIVAARLAQICTPQPF